MYNGRPAAPTFEPSIRVFEPAGPGGPERTICHSFVRSGQIQFLSDCEHELAGQTVPLPKWPDDYGGP